LIQDWQGILVGDGSSVYAKYGGAASNLPDPSDTPRQRTRRTKTVSGYMLPVQVSPSPWLQS